MRPRSPQQICNSFLALSYFGFGLLGTGLAGLIFIR